MIRIRLKIVLGPMSPSVFHSIMGFGTAFPEFLLLTRTFYKATLAVSTIYAVPPIAPNQPINWSGEKIFSTNYFL